MKKETLTLMKEALSQVLINEDTAICKELLCAKEPSDDFYSKLDIKAKEIVSEQAQSIPTKKIIAILVAAALIISAMTLSVSAVRDKFKGLLAEIFDEYIQFSTDEAEKKYEIKDVSFTYIPEGFTLVKEEGNLKYAHLRWENGDTFISIVYRPSNNNSFVFDNEDANLRVETIGENTVYLTEKYYQRGALWTDNKMVYDLSFTSSIDWIEAEKIILGVVVSEVEN